MFVWGHKNFKHFGENLAEIGQAVQKIQQVQLSRSSWPPSCFCTKMCFCTNFMMANNISNTLVKIWLKSVKRFKRYSKFNYLGQVGRHLDLHKIVQNQDGGLV